MTTIFVPIDVPDDKLKEFIANTTVAQIAAQSEVPWRDAAPAPQAPQAPVAPQADPWAQQQPYAPQAPVQPQQQYQQPAPQYQQPVQPSGPTCAHGAMKHVAAGVSKSTNKPYPAFWACPADRNDPSKCRSVPA